MVKNAKVTPRKVGLVANLVRGKSVEVALAILENTNKSASTALYKAIKSAAANATNNFHMSYEKLYVKVCMASDGIKMKRYLPRAKGSASGLVKRASNIRVVVAER